MFAVADVGATIRWYETQLAFVADPFPANEPFVFAILRRNDIENMLQRLTATRKPICTGSAAVACGTLTSE